jgi:uncharacterized membrane protein YeaQ/YmgE (transglycosylase-associated protein family)
VNLEIFVTWIVVGLLTGWAISFVLTNGGHGRISDAILGLAGSGAASMLASALGVPSGAGRGGMAIAAFVGAALITVLQRKIWPSRPLRNVRATDGWNGEIPR